MSIFETLFPKTGHDRPMTREELAADFGAHYLNADVGRENVEGIIEEVETVLTMQDEAAAGGERRIGCGAVSLITAFGPGIVSLGEHGITDWVDIEDQANCLLAEQNLGVTKPGSAHDFRCLMEDVATIGCIVVCAGVGPESYIGHMIGIRPVVGAIKGGDPGMIERKYFVIDTQGKLGGDGEIVGAALITGDQLPELYARAVFDTKTGERMVLVNQKLPIEFE